MKISYSLLLFALLFCSPLYCNSFESADVFKTTKQFSLKKGMPVVVTPDAITAFLVEGKKWKWIAVDGIYIGFSRNQKSSELINDIKSNIQEYNSIFGSINKFEVKMSASQSDMPTWASYFSEKCGVTYKAVDGAMGSLTFHTPEKVSIDLACRVLVYSFTVNGIKLTADKNNNILLATSQESEK